MADDNSKQQEHSLNHADSMTYEEKPDATDTAQAVGTLSEVSGVSSPSDVVPSSESRAEAVPSSESRAEAVSSSESRAEAVPSSESRAEAVPSSESRAEAVPSSEPSSELDSSESLFENKKDDFYIVVKDPHINSKSFKRNLRHSCVMTVGLLAVTVLSVIGFIVLASWSALTDMSFSQVLLCLFGGLFILAVEIILFSFSVFSPERVFKPKLVLPFLERRLNVTDYEWKNSHLAKADIKDARISDNNWMTAEASDRFKANYRGCAFDFYDLKLTNIWKSGLNLPVFMGQLYILPLRESVKCPIRITEYSTKEKLNPQRTISLIKTGCAEFDNRFLVDVLVDEQIDDGQTPKLDSQQAMEYARGILTPEVAAAFVEADDRADSRTRMYFNGDKLYLTHENEFDPFEYHIIKDRKLSVEDLKERVKSEIHRIEQILDVMIERTNHILFIQETKLDLSNVGLLSEVWYNVMETAEDGVSNETKDEESQP